jgi:hypothetical protein
MMRIQSDPVMGGEFASVSEALGIPVPTTMAVAAGQVGNGKRDAVKLAASAHYLYQKLC